MKRGLQFIGPDRPRVTSLAYDPLGGDEIEDGYWGITPDRLILLTYDVESELECEVRRCIQDEMNNNYDILPAETLILRPDGDKLFTMDKYPSALFQYLDSLLDFLTIDSAWTRIF